MGNADNAIYENLADLLIDRVLIYFENETNRKDFEEYYFKKYKEPYQWLKTKGGKL